MNGSVKLRDKKHGNERKPLEGSLSLTRPKSWGEFQSKLKAFQSVRHPGQTTLNDKTSTSVTKDQAESKLPNLHEQNKEKVVFQRKRIFEFNSNDTSRHRPLSAVMLPTPFYKSFQNDSLRDVGTNSTKPAATEIDGNSVENLDMPSLEFEEALELCSDATKVPESVSQKNDIQDVTHTDATAATKLPEGTTLNIVSKHPVETEDKSFPAVNTRLQFKPVITESEFTEIAENDNHPAAVDKATTNCKKEYLDSACDQSEICTNDSVVSHHDDSDVSSVIDKGFYSFEEKENSQSLDAIGPDMHDYNSQTAAAKLNRTFVPTPLRSCYTNAYEIKLNEASESSRSSSNFPTSKSSSSLSSMDATEEESVSDHSRSNSAVTYGYDGDRSTEDGLVLPTENAIPSRPRQPHFAHNTTLKRKTKLAEKIHSGTDSTDSSRAKTPEKVVNLEQPQASARLNNSRYRNKQGSKDDSQAPVGINDLPKDYTEKQRDFHGTWPRKVKSKRRQDQEEAEDLLRKFRETTQDYRTRFRHIYEETRRKIEETMFGLKVAMTKNGYSSKYPNTTTQST